MPIFSITEITDDDNDDQLCIVKLTLCTDKDYDSIFNSKQIKEENEQSNLRTFAKILWKMGKLELSLQYYNQLNDELPPYDPLLMSICEDLGEMHLGKKDYDNSVKWYQKSASIKEKNPDTKTSECIYIPDNEDKIQRPICVKHEACEHLNDEAHRRVFFHHLTCKYGGQCRSIDDEEHSKSYKHPDFCVEGGFCKDMTEYHLVKHRHVALCRYGLTCTSLIKHDTAHCAAYRHCKANCEFDVYCPNFHNSEHIDGENHSFKPPCPYTPYICYFYDKLQESDGQPATPDIGGSGMHCFRFSHICPRGRHCTELSNKDHTQSFIHLIRMQCPDKDACPLLNNEDHLNSYSHPSINDIRSLCTRTKSECPDRLNSEHIKQFRHTGHSEYIGVSRYLGLNKGINFLENQNGMIGNIQRYVQTNWNPTTITIPDEVKRWIRALQPVHRCSKLIFESILLHGHVMSRDHMKSLSEPISVAKAIKEHTKIKRIFAANKNPRFQQTCQEYIRILVEIQFNNADTVLKPDEIQLKDQRLRQQLRPVVLILSDYVKSEDIKAVEKWANEISDAALQLQSNPTGIGFEPDQLFGTNKHVFGVFGPNAGYYYGDIVVVFRRELMHHPDSNFSIQAATTFGKSMNAYRWRPWLKDPGTPEKRIDHFHQNKLHCSIPGYENAATHELVALSGLKAKSTTGIDFDTVKKRWLNIDPHSVFEAHLPQLIPLDYIDRVYIAQTTFDSLSDFAKEIATTVFGDALCITPHQIDITIKPEFQKPLDPSRVAYHSFTFNDMFQRVEKIANELPPVEGTFVTLPSSHFKDYIIIPMTISQSFEQYKSTQTTSTELSNSIYIYWEALNGDMILTLTNRMMDHNVELTGLQCLTCYIGKWPSNSTMKTTTSIQPTYSEGYSYIGNHNPIKHYFIIDDLKFKSSSNTFHRGCNTDDYMTYNLLINRNTNQVTLSIVRSNSIYNQHKLTYTFSPGELDLNSLEFIQLSAGSQTVPIRNLVIKHEPIERYHPSIDMDFIEAKTAPFSSYTAGNSTGETNKDEFLSRKSCPDSIHCLLGYVDTKEAKEHQENYIHPCRFSELCHRKTIEPHYVHIRHSVPRCPQDTKCPKLGEPLHRSEFRHSKLPDYLIPCRHQKQCKTKAADHLVKYSHGETIPLPLLKDN